ncbi:MAG: histidine phosphatase family protein [Acidobacteriota bacterium]
MKMRVLLALCACWLFLAFGSELVAQRAVFLVRHAEKVDDTDDAALTQEGLNRAERLAAILKDAGITAVYTTQFQRTRNTAAPLCREAGIQPVVIPQGEEQKVVDAVRTRHKNDVVMVVGHRSTVIKMLKLFGAREPFAIGPGEHSQIFVVVPNGNGAPTALQLRY